MRSFFLGRFSCFVGCWKSTSLIQFEQNVVDERFDGNFIYRSVNANIIDTELAQLVLEKAQVRFGGGRNPGGDHVRRVLRQAGHR